MVLAIAAYRTGVLFAACLTRESVPVVASPTSTGVPQFDADLSKADVRDRQGVDEIVDGCRDAAAQPDRDRAAGAARVQDCGTSTAEPLDSCLAQAFINQISDVRQYPPGSTSALAAIRRPC